MGKTIRDVADAAGVSTATVSRVMAPENSRPVANKTRLRVMAAAEKLGYRMNHAARSLKRRSTMTVAVVFPELANDFYMDVAEGIERELNDRGYTMLMASSLNSIEEEKKRISMLADRMVDGMLIIPAGSRGDHLQALANRGMPMVLVDRLVEGAGLDAVTSDNEEGTFLLTKALLADGFKRIAFVGGEITLSAARERLSGFARALADAGIRQEPSWICLGGMEVEDGYRLTRTLLESQNPPEAMVAVNLLVHLGMERRLLDMSGFGSRGGAFYGAAPRVVIAGFDEARYTPFLPACRYTASQDAVGMGRRAGQRIIEKIQEKKAGRFESEFSGKWTRAARQIIRLPVTISRSESGAANKAAS
ncbi:MAG: LacI family transcriptional regulator [Treponema sp.]|jgi:LacI family transcriptional regulator|nr:LacI family transcriptional regulator [Treponema sp.]